MRRRIALVLVLLCAGGAVWLQWRPLRLPTRQTRAQPVLPLREDGHAVLLLIDTETTTSGAKRPAALEWVNLLEQRFGACDVMPLSRLDQDGAQSLHGRMLVVFPRASSAALDSSLAPMLDEAVERGAHLLLETPSGFWSRRLGLPAQGWEWREQLPWPAAGRDARRSESRLLDPDPLPLLHHVMSYWPRMGELGLARARSSPAGRPLAWSLDRGAGRWLVLGLDFGELASALRQGVPAENGRIENRPLPRSDARLTTGDLVAAPELAEADQAWLDRWLDCLLPTDFGRMPWARLWPASYDADGFVVLVHEALNSDTRAAWMSRTEADWGWPSTLLLVAPTDSSLTQIGGVAELGLLGRWPGRDTWRDPVAPRTLLGLGPFRPLGRLPGLGAQRDSLQRAIHPTLTLRVHRMEAALWPEDPDDAFGALVAAGFELDLSFGAGPGMGGWCFGSSMPFRPLASDGRMHRLVELPMLAVAGESPFDRARLRRWLRANALGGHGPLTLGFPASLFGEQLSAPLFELWEELPEMAASAGHRPISALALADFLRARAGLRLASNWDGEWLDVEIQPRLPDEARELPEPALALPQRWLGRSLVAWEADWPAARARSAESYGNAEILFELPWQGGHLRARYASP